MATIRAGVQGLESVRAMQRLLDPARFEKAVKGGVAYASKAVPPAAAKGISAHYGISSARIKRDIEKARVSPTGTEATIAFSRRPPTLAQYGARMGARGRQPGLGQGLGWGYPSPTGKPLTALVLRSQGRQQFRGAFLATGSAGNRLVLRRRGGADRAPLVAVYGPSVGSIFLGQGQLSDQLQFNVMARVQEQFEKGFERVWGAVGRGF